MPDETSPTWDQIVYRVSIMSNYLMLVDAARRWKIAFDQMETVRLKLNRLAVESGAQWRGQGGAAFQEHVRGLAKAMETTKAEHEGLVAGVGRLAEALRKAVMTIPIPSWRYAEVQAKQAGFARLGVPPNIEPSWLYQFQHWAAPDTAGLIEGRFNLWRNEAQAAYQRLETAYRQEAAALPMGTPVTPPGARPPGSGQPGVPGGPGGPPGSRVTTGQPAGPNGLDAGAGAGLGGLPPGGLQLPTSTAGLPPPTGQPPNSQLPNLPTAPPLDLPATTTPPPGDLPAIPDPPTSGLAGLGGLGGGPGGGLGGLGGGAGGLPGLGPTAEVPASAAGFGGPGQGPRGLAGAGPGAGAANAVNPGMGMYPPMMPMSPTAAAGGQQGGSDNILNEDEVKVMFGFETGRSAEPEPDIPGGGVLEA